MKIRIVLRRLGAALLLIAAVPVLLLATLLFAPQRLLTSKTVGWAVGYFGSAYRPRWSRFDFAIRSPGLLEKELSVSADGFAFEKADGTLSARFKRLEARFTVELAPDGVRLTKVSSLVVNGESLNIVQPEPASSAPAAKRRSEPFAMPEIEKAAIELPSIEVAGSSGTTTGALRLDFDPARAAPLTLDARWAQRERGGAVHRGRTRVDAASDFFKSGRLTRVDAKGSIVSEGVRAEFKVKARRAAAGGVSVEAEASGRRGALRFHFHGRGVQSPESYAMTGGLGVESSTGPLAGLRLDPFNFSAPRTKGAALPSSVHLDGELRAEPAAFRPVRGFNPPRFVSGRLTLNARATPTLFQKDHFDAEASILLNPYQSWYEAHADLFAQASGRTGDLSRLRLRGRLDASVTVARFEDLVAFLAGGPLAIPAPLAALRGGVTASFSARGEPTSDRVEFDYRGRADLAGEKQKLKGRVSGGGEAIRVSTADRSVRARAQATVDEAAFQLPHLDALKMPKVTLDPRIKTGREPAASPATQEVEESTSAVALELSVGTARPILLYSDLAKTPVPVAASLKLEKPPGLLSGSVEIQAFDVEFFRRRATVDHVTLTFRPGSKRIGLDGLIKYKAAEALIGIRLLGTTDKPQVVFESDPPLSQNDIIAMLVFGKSPDELDADQAATVANTQTAMSDQAFGLASLYLFASTPIQFVGYDPATKSYTMKFRIPGGETLSFNSDFDATKSVQLRKRLARHWAIAAEAVNSQTQGNGVVTFLEWFTRY